MTVQEALVIAGQVSLVVSALLLALAVRVYVVDDIRGVRADLSGRRRMRGLREARRVGMQAPAAELPVHEVHDEDGEPMTQLVQVEVDDTVVAHVGPSAAPSFLVTRNVVVCSGGEL